MGTNLVKMFRMKSINKQVVNKQVLFIFQLKKEREKKKKEKRNNNKNKLTQANSLKKRKIMRGREKKERK